MTTNLAVELQHQLTVARNEINNLRKQMQALSHTYQSDIKSIKKQLTDFRCTNCKEQWQQHCQQLSLENAVKSETFQSEQITFKAIGVIRTDFAMKRAVPRQPSVCLKLLGCIELNKDIFNNPEHSLDRLSDFSHLWIIYYFHKNDSHAKAKVAPPRLGGERVGIFSTRSPHRPCPIGLSLVEIDRIDGCHIYFHGTDMIDGTPVLDIKPYIPRYDSPAYHRLTSAQSESTEDESQLFDGREEPDGEETIHKNTASNVACIANQSCDIVKVPNWILSDATLEVMFNERATEQIQQLQIDHTNIIEVLKNDPRSVYLKTRYGSQIFTFQLGEVTVTCKFNDFTGNVTVVQIRKSEHLSTSIN